MFLLVASLAPAQDGNSPASPTPEGRTVSRIEFRPADQPLPRAELDELLPIHPGDTLRMAGVREAMQKLYETGRYSEISVEAPPEGDGVALIFETAPAFFVSRVNVQGESEPPNRNQLANAAQLDLGSRFEEANTEAAVARIQERLRANGFYNAAIQHHVDLSTTAEEASIYFDIEPGERARFSGMEISAANAERLPESTINSLIRASEWRRGVAFIPLPGWRTATETRVQDGLNNMRRELQKNDRLQARVTLDRLDYDAATNRVTPYLIVDPGPIIEVRALGDRIRKSKLRELVPIYQERTVDRSLLLEGQRNITEHEQSKGYFNATVSFTESEPVPGRSLIEYQIDRGEKHKLRQIAIDGNMYFDTETIRERMYIRPASLLRYRAGRYSPRLLDQDVNAIKALYQTNGFRDVMVEAQVMENPLRSDISIHIQIVEGPQSFVNRLTIEGIAEEDEMYLRSILRSTDGQPFSAANIAADRDTVLSYYYNDGYPDAAFTPSQSVADDPQFINVSFKIDPGERQYVRGVLVRGLETTDPSLVASRIQLKEGDPLSPSRIGASQQNLYDLGIFAKVQTATQNPEGKEDRKYVLFYADEARKYSFNFGVGAELGRIGGGVSTLSSPAGTTGFAPRVSVGVSRINFLGIGHTVSLQTQVSTLQRRALLNYLAPQFKGNPDLALTFSALFNDARDVRTFNARRWEGSAQLSQRFSKSNTGQLRLTYRQVTLSSVNITPEAVPLLSQPVRVGLVGGTFFRDRRDDPVDSKRGTYNSFDAALAAASVDADAPVLDQRGYFTRLLYRNSTYHPINREITLARSLQFGYMNPFGGLSDIPLAERFFAGGASAHRGFPDNQAGPRDGTTGFPLGGKALLFHSTELRFPLIGDNLGAVLFHDMGNVYADLDSISFRLKQPISQGPSGRNIYRFDYMVHAIGTGIRYRTPVGPIRVDVAYGPNTPRFFGFNGTREQLQNVDTSIPLCSTTSPLCVDQRISRVQFHFSLGQTF